MIIHLVGAQQTNYPWGFENRLIPAINGLGHTLISTDYRKQRPRLPDLLAQKADLTLVCKGEGIDPHLVESVPCVTAIWYAEQIGTPESHDETSIARRKELAFNLHAFDYAFSHDPANLLVYKRLGAQRVFPLPCAAVDPVLNHKLDTPKKHDVVFVGSKTPRRKKILEALTGKGIEVYSPDIWDPEKLNILFNESRIVLNLHLSDLLNTETRVAEVLGAGSFLLSETLSDPDLVRAGTHFVQFSSGDIEELADSIRYYLAHENEREAIALNGYRFIHENHTYANRIRTILETVDFSLNRRIWPSYSLGVPFNARLKPTLRLDRYDAMVKEKLKSNSASEYAHGDGEKTSNSSRSGKNPYPASKIDAEHINQFGKIWDEYSHLDSFHIINEPAAKTLRSEFVSLLNRFFLIRNSSILEVGTGSGAFSIELALRESHVTGIDTEESSINLAGRLVNDLHFVPQIEFLVGDGFRLKNSGFRNFDIVFNMGVLELFEDNLLIKMLQEMGESGKYVVVGVPWSGSNIYRLAKEFSIANNTWEYGFERDFNTLKMHFKKAGLYLLHEAVIGGISEAHYLNRINPQAINTAIAIHFNKFFREEQNGNWLIAIGTKDRQYAECFGGLKENERISFENNSVEIIEKSFPSVSIVIPIYNKKNFIKGCLENLSEISYENHEVVFVNDGSNEGTLNTLKFFIQEYKPVIPDIRLINLKENVGIFAARHKGIEQSDGEFVFFHNIDDKIYKNSLKYLAEDYQNFKSSSPILTVSCALMRSGGFYGEVWYSNFWRSLDDIFITEFVNLSGRISIINTLFKKEGLVRAYRNLLEFLSAAGINRMSVAEDSLLSDHMLSNGYMDKNIPVFYTYQGYECNDPNSSSQQIPRRISDIPIHAAYLYNALKKIFDEGTLKELEKKALVNAKMLYGPDNGNTFIKNYLKYKELFNTFRLQDFLR